MISIRAFPMKNLVSDNAKEKCHQQSTSEITVNAPSFR